MKITKIMKTMKLKSVIFDFGGVLLRTHNRFPRNAWDDKLGLMRGEFEDYIFNGPVGRPAQLGEVSWAEVWADAAKKFNLSPEEAIRAQRDFFSGDALDQDLVAYIRRLKARYATGLLSNTWHHQGHTLLLQFGIADAFDFSVTSAGLGVMKPDPRIYQAALEKAEAAPSQAIFVDDMEPNVLAARNLGMQAVYFVDPDAARARLIELTGIK